MLGFLIGTSDVCAVPLQLLEKNPTRYAALSKLIQLLRRAGR